MASGEEDHEEPNFSLMQHAAFTHAQELQDKTRLFGLDEEPKKQAAGAWERFKQTVRTIFAVLGLQQRA